MPDKFHDNGSIHKIEVDSCICI